MQTAYKSGIKVGLMTYGIGFFYAFICYLFLNPTNSLVGGFHEGILIFMFLLAVGWTIFNLFSMLKKRFSQSVLGSLSINLMYIIFFFYVLFIVIY